MEKNGIKRTKHRTTVTTVMRAMMEQVAKAEREEAIRQARYEAEDAKPPSERTWVVEVK